MLNVCQGKILVLEAAITGIYGKEILAQIQCYAFQIGSLKQIKHRGRVAAKELLPSLCTATPRTIIGRRISVICYSRKGGNADNYPKHLSSLSFPTVLACW